MEEQKNERQRERERARKSSLLPFVDGEAGEVVDKEKQYSTKITDADF